MSARPMAEQWDVEFGDFRGSRTLYVRAGNRGTERVVPPAGDEYAFDRQRWYRRIEVYVSPTGRSVRVWVDGIEVTR